MPAKQLVIKWWHSPSKQGSFTPTKGPPQSKGRKDDRVGCTYGLNRLWLGQNELTGCLWLIQPISGITTITGPEPKQVWAELDSPMGTVGVQDGTCPYCFFRCLCCMMWVAGQQNDQYVWRRCTHSGSYWGFSFHSTACPKGSSAVCNQ